MFVFRLHAPFAEVPDWARRQLAAHAGDQPFEVVLTATGSPGGGDDAIDVLCGWPEERLDLERARAFAASAPGTRRGVLTSEGLVLFEGSPAAMALLYQQRGPQDDQVVYQEGARARAAYDEFGGPVPPPRQMYLGLTQRCDRTCTFCVSRSYDFDLLDLAEIEKLAAELGGDLDVIALTGAGEAMTHPNFWAALDMLCELFPRTRFKMNTSGMSLVRKASRLVQYPISNITVSLNAVTRENYERFIGKGLPVVLRGISTLVEARAAAGRADLRLCLSMVLMNSTMPELPDMATLAFRLGVEEIQGIMLMLNDAGLVHESPFHRQEETNKWLDRTASRAAQLGVSASLPPRFGQVLRDQDDQVASLPTTHGHRCVEVFSTIYVRPDGKVMPCPYFDDTLGDTRDSTLPHIWNGPEYERLRAGLRHGDRLPQCEHCCGFSEGGSVDDYASHWLGRRIPTRLTLPLVDVR